MSSSISPSCSPSSPSLLNCQICSQPAHGNHFGAISCRACSAFFRRMALFNKKKTSCRTTLNNCVPTKTGRWYCKTCRYNRCMEAGMTTDKFQLDRDLLFSSENYEYEKVKKRILHTTQYIPDSLESYLGRPHMIICLEPDVAQNKRGMIDISYMADNVANLLRIKPERDFVQKQSNDLQFLCDALKEIRGKQSEQIVHMKKLGKEEFFYFMEYHTETVAKWLTHLDDFQELSAEDQMIAFKRIWSGWVRLERCSLNAQVRGKRIHEDKMYINSDKTMISLGEDVMDCSWFTNYSNQQMRFILENMDNEFLDEFLGPLIELKPTDVELTFMLCQLNFSRTAKKVHRELGEKLERMVEKLADDLHDYYVNEMKNTRYSHRLQQLLKVNKSFEMYMVRRRDKFAVAKLFDVFSVDISDDEWFEEMC